MFPATLRIALFANLGNLASAPQKDETKIAGRLCVSELLDVRNSRGLVRFAQPAAAGHPIWIVYKSLCAN
jgi:hypothetical protein